MLHRDDVQLYDLPEAGGLLFKDPARLEREARLRKVPATWIDAGLALPAPWVDAAAGLSAADPEALASYWLARLAPPARTARKPRRPLEKLEVRGLLEPAEAARRLCATPTALARLDLDGTVPSLRVEDEIRYDATLVDLVARAEDGESACGEDVRAAAEARRAEVRAWARFEYGVAEAAPPPPASFRASAPTPAPRLEAAPEATDAPKAFEIPADLGLESIEDFPQSPGPSSDLMQIEGFETVDED